MSIERDELARELFIADNFNQPREQSIVDWQWFMETPRFAVRVERYKAMAEGAIANGYRKLPAAAQVAPFGFDVTSGMIQDVWDCWVKPGQDADLPQSGEMRVLMAILRNAFAQAESRETPEPLP